MADTIRPKIEDPNLVAIIQKLVEKRPDLTVSSVVTRLLNEGVAKLRQDKLAKSLRRGTVVAPSNQDAIDFVEEHNAKNPNEKVSLAKALAYANKVRALCTDDWKRGLVEEATPIKPVPSGSMPGEALPPPPDVED